MNLDEIRQNTIAQRTNTQNQLNNLANEKTNALNNINTSYNDMIDNSQTYYEQQAQATKDYADTQQALQKEQNDFLIEKINQQKDQTKKDYVKEQKGAYADYMRANDEYGVNRERLAQQGLTNGGYEASADYKYYNTYQNRVANARDTYNKAILNYDNSIKDAMLQNNSKLAEISYNALQSQLQLALEGMQYKNKLLENKLSAVQTTENMYASRFDSLNSQINSQNNLLAELEQMERDWQYRQQQLALEREQMNRSYSSYGGYGGDDNEIYDAPVTNTPKYTKANASVLAVDKKTGKKQVLEVYTKGGKSYYINPKTGKYTKFKGSKVSI